LITVFAVSLAFLGDADRGDTFFAVFLLVLIFVLRMVALVTGAFFRFPLALPLAFLLVAIKASRALSCKIVAE
jgi:hypothetical protein